MKIAIIGASDSVEKIKKFVKNEYKDIDFVYFKHDEVESLNEIFPLIPRDIDGIFATGIGVYNSVKEYNFSCPISYAKRGAVGLIKTFFDLYSEGKDLKDKIISFDAIDTYYINNVIKEFNIPIKNYYSPENPKDKSEAFHIDNHLKLYHDHKIDYIFTSFGYIYSLFSDLNLPVRRVYPSRMDITSNINSLIKAININNLDKQSLMVYRFDNKDEKKNESLRNFLKDFSNSVEGFFTESGKTSFTIISNKGFLDDEACLNYMLNTMSREQKSALKDLRVGIATGATIGQAISNADIALSNTSSLENVYFYDGHVLKNIAHYPNDDKTNYLSDERIEKISLKTGIRTKHIQTIFFSMSALNRNIFTSKEIADILNLTSRSANRIINLLIENKFAKEVLLKGANEGVGRPKRQVEINFWH